jgi:hypothetical protein
MNIAATMNFDLIRWRRLGAAIALAMLICGVPSHAWCASANLWVGFAGVGIESYTSRQLKKSGMPTPIHMTGTFANETGLAFDKSNNLWAVSEFNSQVVRFTAAQLKNLKTTPNPTPGVIITSTSTFANIIGCNFDLQGNLWIVDANSDSIDELSKEQLAAGSGDVTPAIVITSTDLDLPFFVTFDKAGNAWVDSAQNNKIAEFSASQLTSGGSKLATVLLSDDGSFSISHPAEIAFDKKGNLWVPNFFGGTVVEFAKGQLTSSGNPAPTVKLSSAIFDEPFGAVFDSKGDLVVMNVADGTIAKFTAKQLKVSGAPVPKVSVTGTQNDNYQIIFGPAS